MSAGARPFPRVARQSRLACGHGLVQAVVSLAGLPGPGRPGPPAGWPGGWSAAGGC